MVTAGAGAAVIRALAIVSTVFGMLMAVASELPPLEALASAGTEGLERYVGSHPMAGSERSGPTAASENLFEGRAWAITPHAAVSDVALELGLARQPQPAHGLLQAGADLGVQRLQGLGEGLDGDAYVVEPDAGEPSRERAGGVGRRTAVPDQDHRCHGSDCSATSLAG